MNSFRVFRATMFLLASCITLDAVSQCRPSIRIDGNICIVDESSPANLHLPVWLRQGQTLAIAQSTFFISVIEFNAEDGALEFNQVLTVTSVATVPDNKVWKVESVAKQLNPSSYISITYSVPGTYTWIVPACASYICVEAWGAGGGSGANSTSSGSFAGAGGGGAYGQECFNVVPGTSYTVVVGAAGTAGTSGGSGGTGGSSSVTGLISAGGGGGGGANAGGAGGAGGTSTAANTVAGGNGSNGQSPCNTAGLSSRGGTGGNGGAGHINTSPCGAGGAGTAPGGGASAGGWNNTSGFAGGIGRLIITW